MFYASLTPIARAGVAAIAVVSMSSLAFAGNTTQVKTPLGKEITAQVVKAPAADTPEYSIIDSIKMLSKGNMDGWMTKWCYKPRCETPEAIDRLKAYTLSSATKNASKCLFDGDSIYVTNRKENAKVTPPETKIFTYCGDDRMPVPTSLRKLDDGSWKISTLSF